MFYLDVISPLKSFSDAFGDDLAIFGLGCVALAVVAFVALKRDLRKDDDEKKEEK